MHRRTAMGIIAGAPVLLACQAAAPAPHAEGERSILPAVDPVLGLLPLGSAPWPTRDPFLFCAHHDDAYPAGNAALGPEASLAGRAIGSDFDPREAWRMYHGERVPGFPEHPHRGFETVTVVRRGLVDHSDSMGAAARYGRGDVQWLTAGGGIVHAEMFPLLDSKGPNPLELFQIWLNLPSTDKLVAPHFSMLWNETIPRQTLLDSAGRRTELSLIAGKLGPVRAPAPPPKSWAARASNDVAIWTLKLAPEARFALPAAAEGSTRTLYFFRGNALGVGARTIPARQAIEMRANIAVELTNGPDESELLLLQGRPIGEPVARRGPFVMNTAAEITDAYNDYRATGFGGWPWPSSAPVHDREVRFARHADGHLERKG